MIKISVIIPAYNAEKSILNTLKSVINQTYKNIELIVINDGSLDNTLKVIDEFWKIYNPDGKVISISNGGLANARNIGLENATGDYICNLDADDYLESNIFETIFLNYKFDFDICYFGYREISENGSLLLDYKKKFIYTSDKVLNGITAAIWRTQKKIWIRPGSAIYKKTMIIDNMLYNIPGVNQGEDLYFITSSLVYAKQVCCIPQIGLNVIAAQDSMMRSNYNKSFNETLVACKNLLLKVEGYQTKNNDKDKLLKCLRAEYLNQHCYVAKKIISSFPVFKLYKIKQMIKANIPECKENIKDLSKVTPTVKIIEFKLFMNHLTLYIIITKIVYAIKLIKVRLKNNGSLF